MYSNSCSYCIHNKSKMFSASGWDFSSFLDVDFHVPNLHHQSVRRCLHPEDPGGRGWGSWRGQLRGRIWIYINYQADMWMMLANVRKGEYITLNAYLIEILKKVSKCQSCSNRFLHNSLRVLRSSLLCILYSLTLSNNTDMSALRKSLCKPRPPW